MLETTPEFENHFDRNHSPLRSLSTVDEDRKFNDPSEVRVKAGIDIILGKDVEAWVFLN